MAFKLGKRGEDLGVLAGGLLAMAGGPLSLAAAPFLYSAMRDKQRGEDAAQQQYDAENTLIGGAGGLAGLDQNTGITWNQDRPGTRQALQQATMVAPEARAAALKAATERMFPGAPTKDDFLGTPGAGGVFDIRNRNIVPGTQIAPEKPVGTRGWFKDKRTGKVFQGYENAPGIQQALATGEIELAQDPNAGPQRNTFRAPTAEEMTRLGLDPSGTYQVNDQTGQVSVVKQPKQSNPTEGQQKYAYNARRVADALTTIKDTLAKDPSAITNVALNATEGSWIPGAELAGKAFTNPNAQIVRNNLADAIDGLITLGTGAAYTEEQLKAARNSFLPQPGEKDDVKADKFRKMQVLYGQARENARAANIDLPDPAVFNDVYKPTPPQAATPPTSQTSLANAQRINTQQEFDALPSGSLYIDPDDNKMYRKP